MNGYTELLIATAALALFGSFVLNTSRIMLSQDLHENRTQVEMEALNMAGEIVNEAMLLPFDATMDDDGLINDASVFTPSSNFGLASGETVPVTFDDYHNYSITENGIYGNYEISCAVHYTQGLPPVNLSSVQSFHKRLRVQISHAGSGTEVTLQYTKSYF